jgi:hypothetical protein
VGQLQAMRTCVGGAAPADGDEQGGEDHGQAALGCAADAKQIRKERPMAKWAEIDAALAAIRKGGE